MTESVSTPTPDRPEVVRELTPEELHDWMPHVGQLAPGVRAVWVDLLRTPDWEAIPDGVEKTCRQPRCQELAVAELRRTGRSVTWWAYCPAHVTGSWTAGEGTAAGQGHAMLLTRRLAGAPTPEE